MDTIENQVHFTELASKTSNYPPYVLVRRLDDRRQLYIPLRWMRRPNDARKAMQNEVLTCYYSTNLDDFPYRRYLVKVNVITVFEGSDSSNSKDESIENANIGRDKSNANIITTDEYDEKLLQMLFFATEKSSQTRINALQAIAETLSHRYLPDLVENRKKTIMYIVEKAIRRGKGTEQSLGAQIVPMLILHLSEGEEVLKVMAPLLHQTMLNKSNSFDVRSKCCASLALAQFLGGNDIGDLVQLMHKLEIIFSGSYLKGDHTPSNAGADASQLHCAALHAWGLLLTLVPSGDFVALFNSGVPSIDNLIGLLESAHLDMRTTIGEVLALVLESGRAHDENFLEEYLPELIDSTKRLATDSNKFYSKCDRRSQRATFRDVVHYLEEDTLPELTIRFGLESLRLDTWSIHARYKAICSILGPGMTTHLAENDYLRNVLQLDDKVMQPMTIGMKQQNRMQRNLINAAAFKARTVSRNRSRDKRMVIF